MGKWCLHASLFLGNKDMFKNYKRFDFWHVQTANIGDTKPWKNNCSLIWKLFKFLMTLLAGLFEMRGCWHIGLRWVIVALWATCFTITISSSFFIPKNTLLSSFPDYLFSFRSFDKSEWVSVFVMSKPVSILTWFWKLSICWVKLFRNRNWFSHLFCWNRNQFSKLSKPPPEAVSSVSSVRI